MRPTSSPPCGLSTGSQYANEAQSNPPYLSLPSGREAPPFVKLTSGATSACPR